jgi:hypothetical protein
MITLFGITTFYTTKLYYIIEYKIIIEDFDRCVLFNTLGINFTTTH